MLSDLAGWRNEVLVGFVELMQREVHDIQQALLETCSWRVISLLSTWRQCELSAPTAAAAAKVCCQFNTFVLRLHTVVSLKNKENKE